MGRCFELEQVSPISARICGKIAAEFSLRSNDKPLARVLKEQLCRTGRFRIENEPCFANGDGAILRQRFAVDDH